MWRKAEESTKVRRDAERLCSERLSMVFLCSGDDCVPGGGGHCGIAWDGEREGERCERTSR